MYAIAMRPNWYHVGAKYAALIAHDALRPNRVKRSANGRVIKGPLAGNWAVLMLADLPWRRIEMVADSGDCRWRNGGVCR